MSDTQEKTRLKPGANIPNFAYEPGMATNGEVATKVRFGDRNVEFRKLNLADSWDVMEIAGSSPNPGWLNMAMVAASITQIDGVPVPPMEGVSRRELRSVMSKLGIDGLSAVMAARAAMDPAGVVEDGLDTAKN